MIYQNDYFFERFDVLFGKKSSIVAGEEYPLGFFAAEVMDMDAAVIEELKKLTQQASQKFGVFLTARTASSAGMAVQALDQAWDLIMQLPLYNKIPYREGRGSSVSGLSMSYAAMSRSWTGCSQWGRQRMRCCVVGTGCITAWQTIFSGSDMTRTIC